MLFKYLSLLSTGAPGYCHSSDERPHHCITANIAGYDSGRRRQRLALLFALWIQVENIFHRHHSPHVEETLKDGCKNPASGEEEP